MSDVLDDEVIEPEGQPDTEPDTDADIPEEEESAVPITVELIVEDGSCVIGANSYVELEYADTYHSDRFRSEWLELDEEVRKACLIKATQYVDNLFTWKGRRKFESQELCFPRVMLRDRDHFEVKGIPAKLKAAICEAAFYGKDTELFAVYDTNGAIKRQRVEGAVEVEYFNSTESEVEYISKYAALNSMLKGLYVDKNASSLNAHVCWRF